MHYNASEEVFKNMSNLKMKLEILKTYGSQIEFAKKVGVSELFVSQVITGRRKLSPEMLKVWDKALQCKRVNLKT